jgi:4-amino-4-deoxy-L-arabinose transferase-like glycosyltransferase
VRRESVAADLLWIALAVLVFVGAGIGVRDPWPADEPRFALIARDMVASGDWLFPRVGGELYAEKPPFYFWLLAAFYALTGSLRASFPLPSLLAAFGTLVLVYDLARRAYGRVAGLSAAFLLLCTIEFVTSARSAQIDATLCLLTTASLYGLLRHLLYGPAWGLYFLGGLAAGLGVITKGVGFLPLLVLLPYAGFRKGGFEPLPAFAGGVRWGLAPLGLVIGMAVWLVPLLTEASRHPELAAYRDTILFHQTVDRYANPWHHTKPVYYFVVDVIPVLWLPVSLLTIWLVPRWRDAWRRRDSRVWLPLAWALLVLVFFSLSAGKRGIYILPALPAVVLAAAPYLESLFARAGVQRASLVLAGMLLGVTGVVVFGWLADAEAIKRAGARLELASIAPFAVFLVGGVILWALAWRQRPIVAWPAVLAMLAAIWGFGIAPAINDARSGRAFMARMLSRVQPDEILGFVAYREQFLLYVDRPIVNFGVRRWVAGGQEELDAASWLASGPKRVLLVPGDALKRCFSAAHVESVGRTSRETRFLVRGAPAAECVQRGDPTRAIRYAG